MNADGALADVNLVVDVLLHQRSQPGELGVPEVRGAVGRARDDQRGAGLVDQDGVDLVDDGEVVTPLNQLVQRVRHVVAQVVEAVFVVGSVGDVGAVGGATLVGGQPGQDHPDVQTEESVHATHPLAVTFGQVIVDRDDVDTLAAQRIEVCRQHTRQSLALTGLHLRDVAEVQRRPAHDLDVEVSLAQHPPRGLAGHRKGLRKQIVELRAGLDTSTELVGLGPQFGVGELLHLVGQRIDVVSDPFEPLDRASFSDAQQLRQHSISPVDWRFECPPS